EDDVSGYAWGRESICRIAKSYCLFVVIHNARGRRRGAALAILPDGADVGTGRRFVPRPSSATASGALAHERFERGDLRLVAFEILRDLLVEMRGAEIELVRGRILTDEIGDLVHLRDPAIGLGRHQREVALEPRQHLRLAALQLGEQRIGAAAAG